MDHASDPTAASWLIALVAFLSPSPIALLKGATRMQLPIDEIRTALAGAQGLVKLGLEFIPGTTPEEDTALILATIEPSVKTELDRLGLPPVVQGIALKFLEWAVASEVKAAAST